MNFIEELKRRKVFRVAASYAVVAFIIMQLVEILFPMFNFPQWTQQFTVIIVLLGFPIAVILSWVFDKTPQGYVKTDASEAKNIGGMSVKVDDRPFYMQKRNIFLVLGVIAGGLIGIYGGSSLTKSTLDEKSIAVLPFDNLGNDENDEIFSDGITEDIISHLSNIKDIRVIARTSVLQYKGTTKNIIQIAKELGVNNILEGSVRRIDDDVRIVSQLIDVNKDDHLWSDTYDRKMRNIFEVQSDVARKIASALKSELSPDEESRISQIPTDNLEAYTLYKQGMDSYHKYNEKGFEESISFFKKALNVDPMFALAYAGIADSYAKLFIAKNDDTYSLLGFSAAEKALTLDKNLAEGYKALAHLYGTIGDDTESLRNNLKAVKLKPSFSSAISNVGLRYRRKGDLSESLDWTLRARKIDPNNRVGITHFAGVNYLLGEREAAENIYLNEISNDKYSYPSYQGLIFIYLKDSRFNKAKYYLDEVFKLMPNDERALFIASNYYLYIKDYEKALSYVSKINNPNDNELLLLSFINYKLGKNYDLKTIESKSLQVVNEGGNYYFENPYLLLSQIYSIRNNKSEAYRWFDQAIDEGFSDYKLLLSNPLYDNIRGSTTYNSLINKMKDHVDRERLEAGLES